MVDAWPHYFAAEKLLRDWRIIDKFHHNFWLSYLGGGFGWSRFRSDNARWSRSPYREIILQLILATWRFATEAIRQGPYEIRWPEIKSWSALLESTSHLIKHLLFWIWSLKRVSWFQWASLDGPSSMRPSLQLIDSFMNFFDALENLLMELHVLFLKMDKLIHGWNMLHGLFISLDFLKLTYSFLRSWHLFKNSNLLNF